MVNKWLKCLKTMNMLDSKLFKEKKKQALMIYTDFENILVPDDIWKQNPENS